MKLLYDIPLICHDSHLLSDVCCFCEHVQMKLCDVLQHERVFARGMLLGKNYCGDKGGGKGKCNIRFVDVLIRKDAIRFCSIF
jgi:hypothetical protein